MSFEEIPAKEINGAGIGCGVIVAILISPSGLTPSTCFLNGILFATDLACCSARPILPLVFPDSGAAGGIDRTAKDEPEKEA